MLWDNMLYDTVGPQLSKHFCASWITKGTNLFIEMKFIDLYTKLRLTTLIQHTLWQSTLIKHTPVDKIP